MKHATGFFKDLIGSVEVYVKELRNPEEKDEVRAFVVIALSEAGEFFEARLWAKRIKTPYWKVVAYAAIASTGGSDFKKAYQLMEEVPNEHLQDRARVAIASALIRKGEIQEALKMETGMNDAKHRAVTFAMVAKDVAIREKQKQAEE